MFLQSHVTIDHNAGDRTLMTLDLTATAPPRHDLQAIQRRRKWILRGLLGGALVVLLVTDSQWSYRKSPLYEIIEALGTALILACIAGRTWCSLYIGGRKKRELITVGPYSIVRNPLYVFSTLGAVGIGAQSGTLTIALVFALVTVAVFMTVIRSEERFLASEFPGEFPAYADRVPRFWPSFKTWRDIDELTIKPKLVRQTFFDTCLFLASIPAADALEILQRHGIVPVLMWLY